MRSAGGFSDFGACQEEGAEDGTASPGEPNVQTGQTVLGSRPILDYVLYYTTQHYTILLLILSIVSLSGDVAGSLPISEAASQRSPGG